MLQQKTEGVKDSATAEIPELTAGNTGDHRLAAITLCHVQRYVPRSMTSASTAFTP
jgi:hypothetical protein